MVCHFACSIVSPVVNNKIPVSTINESYSYNGKKRELFLSSRGLLAEMLFYLYGISELPTISTDVKGRSHFIDLQLPDFDFSYAGNNIALLLSDEGRVGVDIELIHAHPRNSSPLQQRYLSTLELSWIEAQIDPVEAETQLRVIRNSIMKIGAAGDESPNSINLYPTINRLRSASMSRLQVISGIDDYMVWACSKTPSLSHLIHWHYHPVQGLQKQESDTLQTTRLTRYSSLPPIKSG